jgi:hypothetical protein
MNAPSACPGSVDVDEPEELDDEDAVADDVDMPNCDSAFCIAVKKPPPDTDVAG